MQSDVEDLIEGLNDLAVAQWLARVPHPYTRANAEAWVNHCVDVATARAGARAYEFAIELRGERKVIGGVSLERVDPYQQTAGGGIWLSGKYGRRGYGSEAFGEKIRFAFEDLGLRRLENGFFEGNLASMKMQQWFGYKVEGMRRNGLRCMADDKIRNEYITGLLRDEWIRHA
jgi:ribosomal-protein-alanine N-acetyltransferase